MPTPSLADTLEQLARLQRGIEQRRSVAAKLRELADRISPAEPYYVTVRARVRFDPTTLQPHVQHTPHGEHDDPTDQGVRVFVRRDDMDRIVC